MSDHDERVFPTADHHLDTPPMELRLRQSVDGDWYLSIVHTDRKFSRHEVRIAADDARYPRLPRAVARLYEALGDIDERGQQ